MPDAYLSSLAGSDLTAPQSYGGLDVGSSLGGGASSVYDMEGLPDSGGYGETGMPGRIPKTDRKVFSKNLVEY